MRKLFAHLLSEVADTDPRTILLTADLGYGVLDEFVDRHPDKFYNVGVAEQAMIGAATGLAKEGFIPYAYSIGTFAAFRPFEFIRNGPIQHNLPVRIVGTGRDREYGHAGFSHWPENDVEVLLTMGLWCYVPKDDDALRRNFPIYHNSPHPLYLSLSRFDKPQ